MSAETKLTAKQYYTDTFPSLIDMEDTTIAHTKNAMILFADQFANQQTASLQEEVEELKKDNLHYAINVCPEKDREYEALKQVAEKMSNALGNAEANNSQYGYLCNDTISDIKEALESYNALTTNK